MMKVLNERFLKIVVLVLSIVVLTQEAKAWLSKYESKLMAIAEEKGMKSDAINALNLAKSPFVGQVGVDTIKSVLSSYGIDVSQFK